MKCLVKQTHRKPQDTLDSKLTKPRETFSLKAPMSIEGSWMIGLTSSEVNISFLKTGKNNKFELYTDLFDKFSSTELKDELGEIFDISKTSSEHLQDKIMGPRIIEA